MALGNANTKAQARGKNKAVKVRRRKEVRTAKNYKSLAGSVLDPVARDACRLSPTTTTYYYNGAGLIPRPGEIIYREKRARGNNRFGPGFIHFRDRGRSFTIQINEAGMVVDRCLLYTSPSPRDSA